MKLNLDKKQFLAEYWQQKPLLIRDAVSGFKAPVDANELAGLAMEDFIESRIIDTMPDTWALHHGPFEEADFAREQPWTLLIQAVDHYVQEVAELLKLVDFVPNWRIDDVMVSYAVDGGSVGPHYDNYDVFLLQGEGTRLWKLGQQCHSASPLLPHDELRILDSFTCSAQYLLQPGDMLYVPPGVAHWGIAQGECTTFSLGFRAPRINDMLSRWVDEMLEHINPELFYTDTGQAPALRAGEIRLEDLQRAKQQLMRKLSQNSNQHWFGELVTEPRYTQDISGEELTLGRDLLEQGMSQLVLLPSSKLAWQEGDGEITVFANGVSRVFPKTVLPIVLTLCKEHTLEAEQLQQAGECDDCRDLLDHLLTLACITIE